MHSRSLTRLSLLYSIVVVLVASLLPACATFQPASQDQLSTVETIEETDVSKEDGFERLRRWVAETYNSANDVVQLQDAETGEIVVKGQELVGTVRASYTMAIDVRDGRVRFRQTPGEARGAGGNYFSVNDARALSQFFEDLRRSALAAIAVDDTF